MLPNQMVLLLLYLLRFCLNNYRLSRGQQQAQRKARHSAQGTAQEHTAAVEAVMALTALGYSSADATRAVRQVDGGADMDSEALLKAALKKLAFM